MPKFKRRPTPPEGIDAEQFLLGRGVPDGVTPVWAKWDGEDFAFLGEARGSSIQDYSSQGGVMCYAVKTHSGWAHVEHGDWIVSRPDGERYPVKPHDFEQLYEPIGI